MRSVTFGSLLLLLSLFFAQAASAAYMWAAHNASGSMVANGFSSPDAACKHLNAATSAKFFHEFTFKCYEGVYEYGQYARRYGDSCADPKAVYDPYTGKCETPQNQCEPLTGQTTSASSVYPDMKYEFCINKCSAAVTSVEATSTPKAFGPTYIYYKAMFTGESCAEDTPQPENAPVPPEPTESEEDKDCGPVERVQDAEGRMHEISKCVTEQSTRENQQCSAKGGSMGDVNGVATCIESKKGPTTTETKKEEKKETTTEPDGAKKESNTTTTETTVCKGGTCTTTKTTTNNSTNTNADGTPGGGSSSCKGDKCSQGGKEGGTGGGGSGSGSNEGEEEKPESSVGGESCSAELNCSGDVIQCAILRKNKEMQCAWDYDKAKPQIEAAVQGSEYQLGTSSVNLGNSFNEGASAARWLGSSCPPDRSFSVTGHSFSLSWQPLCNFASSLSYVIVAMAGLFFAVYVGRGLGGQ